MSAVLAAGAEPVTTLNTIFLRQFPRTAARKLETMPARDAAEFLGEYPAAVVAPTWIQLAPGVTDKVLPYLETDAAIALLLEMDSGPCAALLSRLSEGRREACLEAMPPERSAELRELLQYPADTAGRMMDTRVIAFDREITVDAVIKQLRAQEISELHHLFLLDDELHLCGQVEIQHLALADEERSLASISVPLRGYFSPLDPEEEVIATFEKTRAEALPVVDLDFRLMGIIYQDQVMEAVKDDIAGDLQTMVGVSRDERALSSGWFAVKKRLPWLHINLLTAFLASAVVGAFESTIAQFTALAVLLPIAAGQAGNTGAQALAVTMRGLTLREITTRHWLRVMLKEASAGAINGIAIAITCSIGVFWWSGSYGLALIIALSMVTSMIIAGLAGALVPMVLKKLGQDPAASSSIILTTVTDIAGFMSFLGIATLLSGML
jgi:magnesium transporter